MTGVRAVQIGALVPLTRPGWVEAGRHLLAGLELAVTEVNGADGIAGRPLELVIRDTAADPQKAAAAVAELARMGVSFVAFEGYDTVTVLADVLRSSGADRARVARSWPSVAVEGTRGQIQFSRTPGINVWQRAWPPIQVADRDPAKPDRFRVLSAAGGS